MAWYDSINNYLSQHLGQIWSIIVELLKKLGISLKEFFNSLFQGFIVFLQQIIVEVLDVAKSTIDSIFMALQNFIHAVMGLLPSYFAEKITEFWNYLYTSISAICGPLSPLVLVIIITALILLAYIAFRIIIVVIIP